MSGIGCTTWVTIANRVGGKKAFPAKIHEQMIWLGHPISLFSQTCFGLGDRHAAKNRGLNCVVIVRETEISDAASSPRLFCSARVRSWPKIEVARRPRFGRDPGQSRHYSDIAKVKRLTLRDHLLRDSLRPSSGPCCCRATSAPLRQRRRIGRPCWTTCRKCACLACSTLETATAVLLMPAAPLSKYQTRLSSRCQVSITRRHSFVLLIS
jgi:hypothetical protein